ncbi:MAG: KaiC domain-containing protein [bacterium]
MVAKDTVNSTIPEALPLSKIRESIPKLFGIPSGVPGLDDLFFTFEYDVDEPRRIPLGGFPSSAVIHITGVPDTGKSIMGEQFALSQASRGYNVLFVSVEIPTPFLAQSLRERARALRIDWDEIEDRIFVLDVTKYPELRDNIVKLDRVISETIENNNIKSTIVDSITGLYEGKEMLARTIVRKLYEVMKRYYQTSIFISQKRSSHEEESAEAAGGYAVPHILDCTIVLSKMVLSSKALANLYNRSLGDTIHTLRIDGCRMCGHDRRTHLIEIDERGVIRVIGPIETLVRR